MDEMRKKVIIKEIHYWKETRILPEQYCNYLLALYSEGDEEEFVTVKRKPLLSYLFVTLIIVSALIVNYFTENILSMQIPLYLFLIGLLIVITIFEYKKNGTLLIPLIASAFVLVLLTVNTWESFFPKQMIFLYVGLLCNCLIWIVIGKKLSLQYFLVAGILGSIIVAYFVFVYYGLL
ncbi:hypothetical protein [Bacillus massiliigorillae]|uniref:hypothetical protein n=1 Tax=Bacillus massiliigorillae TaxID=1243664 RepID=UPI0003A067AC|nr:hypothetical protein [Bacillus massiliigorillae]